ncbi:MAG: hypothetical protein A2X56_05500 [Nitrospirae bacterium GWC2_57_13]|jgi:hypothetical protein|nr:MAG: hypothetical protein A2X56_05500 [Nitrospirae bacterium GWC2_57_13]HAS55200.1 hypothetical protein [Nitrospiraceae bacterium]
MILWTIQTSEAWKRLQEKGVLRADDGRISEDMRLGYGWMANQMRRRLGPPPMERAALLWAWYQWSGVKRKRPDLRSAGHLPAGSRGVRIEFEIDDGRVLLSDFDLWHYVLNYWYLPVSEADGDAFLRELQERGLSFYTAKPVPDPGYHGKIERSWERIFDLQWTEEALVHPRERKSIQACIWELRWEQVKRADQFIAR